jgi:hypothetical protein
VDAGSASVTPLHNPVQASRRIDIRSQENRSNAPLENKQSSSSVEDAGFFAIRSQGRKRVLAYTNGRRGNVDCAHFYNWRHYQSAHTFRMRHWRSQHVEFRALYKTLHCGSLDGRAITVLERKLCRVKKGFLWPRMISLRARLGAN